MTVLTSAFYYGNPPTPDLTDGYGLESYGIDEWGFGDSELPELSIESAIALTTHTVRVTLTAEPMHRSPIAPGDALNPDTWVLTRADEAAPFVLLEVEEISALVFQLRTWKPLGPARISHTVSAVAMRGSDGSLVTPTFFVFPGLLAAAEATDKARMAGRRLAMVDLSNPQLPQVDPSPGGTLLIEAGGDYASDSGSALVKKLIIRRLTTPRGGFFHLPDYGVGLVLKEPLPSSDLVKLAAEIERQVKLEPEVLEAVCNLTQLATGALFVQVRARLKTTGETIPIDIATPPLAL